MAQPATPPANQSAANASQPKYSEAILTSEPALVSGQQTVPTGQDIALHALENALIGDAVSAKTNQLIHKQLADLQPGNPTDTLNLLTALVMGSPEFQLR
jgi:hypothetical protein